MASINIKMNWQSTLPLLLALLESGSADGQAYARSELERMAKAADRAVRLQEEVKK